jgi:RNA-binding protein
MPHNYPAAWRECDATETFAVDRFQRAICNVLQGPFMLTGKQRHHLRGLGHALHPIVHVGKGGVDEGLIKAVDQALADHELIKVKVGESADLDRHAAAEKIAAESKSDVAQVIGNIVLLYRAHPEHPKIELP